MLSKFKVALDKEASNMRLRPVCMRETDVEVDALIELIFNVTILRPQSKTFPRPAVNQLEVLIVPTLYRV